MTSLDTLATTAPELTNEQLDQADGGAAIAIAIWVIVSVAVCLDWAANR